MMKVKQSSGKAVLTRERDVWLGLLFNVPTKALRISNVSNLVKVKSPIHKVGYKISYLHSYMLLKIVEKILGEVNTLSFINIMETNKLQQIPSQLVPICLFVNATVVWQVNCYLKLQPHHHPSIHLWTPVGVSTTWLSLSYASIEYICWE